MSKRYFGRDAITGAVEWFDYDDSNDTFAIGRQGLDIQPVIDQNKEWSNHLDTRTPDGAGRLVAQIPIDVTYIWLQRYGVRVWDKNHLPAVKRLLNDSEWRYLKCQNIIL